MKPFMVIVLLVIAAMAFMAGPALAHKLGVYAYEEGGLLKAEGYYANGDPCKGCSIEAYDPATGALIAKGATGEDGILLLPSTYISNGAASVRLMLKAPGGHMTEQTVPLEKTRASTERKQQSFKESALGIVIGISIIGFFAVIYSYIKSRKNLL